MHEPYQIKNKTLRIVQDLLDSIKKNPENKEDLCRNSYKKVKKEDITDLELRKTVEKICDEMKDFDYEVFSEIEKT